MIKRNLSVFGRKKKEFRVAEQDNDKMADLEDDRFTPEEARMVIKMIEDVEREEADELDRKKDQKSA